MKTLQTITLLTLTGLFTIGKLSAQAPKSQPPIGGIRIGWDYSTLKKVSTGDVRNAGYARMIQLHDGSLICVYEGDGNTVAVTSTDSGKTWGSQVMIAPKENGVNMAVPDILQLADHTLLAMYNPRPRGNDSTKHFAIRTKRSTDNGKTWSDERVLYQAGSKFQDGCWEPSAVQLPSGEIQLFFANEGDYTKSNEQNISMVRSKDGGLTWTSTREIVSFRAGSRDGMPVPVLLNNGKEIAYAIEDNGFKNFKPYIIRSTLQNNWSATVNARSADRNYALSDKIPDSIYAGAPYLRQLKTGETILSYQGTEGRINNMNHSEMKVVIGDADARNFNRKSSPFNLDPGKSGLWNSLSVLNDNTVVALTSMSNYASKRGNEVWMIKGQVIPELKAAKQTMKIDGGVHDNESWENADIFIGQQSWLTLNGGAAYNDHFLYFFTKVIDGADSSSVVTYYIDPRNKHYEAPGAGNYKISLSGANKIQMYTCNNGGWVAAKATGIKAAVSAKHSGYIAEIAIPWAAIGGKPALNKRIGLNISLTTSQGYTENISGNDADKPFTWCTLKLY